MAIGLIIIGDEILSGRRGLQLAWAEYVDDDPVRITAMFKRALASGDIVFSYGGIDADADDGTNQSRISSCQSVQPAPLRHIEFGVKREPEQTNAAFDKILTDHSVVA